MRKKRRKKKEEEKEIIINNNNESDNTTKEVVNEYCTVEYIESSTNYTTVQCSIENEWK